jgi:hypothetical protein
MQSDFMGRYVQSTEYPRMNGGNVYTKEDDADKHFFRETDGTWIASKTEWMLPDASGKQLRWIECTSANPSPLGHSWKAFDGSSTLIPDPLLTVTEST